jgi:hypothetical protein
MLDSTNRQGDLLEQTHEPIRKNVSNHGAGTGVAFQPEQSFATGSTPVD